MEDLIRKDPFWNGYSMQLPERPLLERIQYAVIGKRI